MLLRKKNGLNFTPQDFFDSHVCNSHSTNKKAEPVTPHVLGKTSSAFARINVFNFPINDLASRSRAASSDAFSSVRHVPPPSGAP